MRNESETAPSPQTSPLSAPMKRQEPLDMETLRAKEEAYWALRRNVSVGVLIAAPVIIAMPPRKLDIFSFGLTGIWLFCLNDLVKRKYGDGIVDIAAGKRRSQRGEAVDPRGGWRGEDVRSRFPVEEEKGILEQIQETIWEVWQQKDKRNLTPEEEEREARPLKERLEEELRKKEAEAKK